MEIRETSPKQTNLHKVLKNKNIHPDGKLSGYHRFSIDTVYTPPRIPKPFSFLPTVNKIGLTKLLVKEVFHYNFKLIKSDYRQALMSRPCIYGVFSGPIGGFNPIKEKCTGCLRCVQEYPDVCNVEINPEFDQYTDSFWRRKDPIYSSTSPYSLIINEAETGKIPVKGMGYKGSFADEGWDSIWTDMSEIVRPTRDGIYGREFISTKVTIGSKLGTYRELSDPIESSLPILFDLTPVKNNKILIETLAKASEKNGTYFLIRPSEISAIPRKFHKNLIYSIEDMKYTNHKSYQDIRIIEINIVKAIGIEQSMNYNDIWKRLNSERIAEIENLINKLKSNGKKIILRIPFTDGILEGIEKLSKADIDGFHLFANYHGQTYEHSPRFISRVLREVHEFMLKKNIRDKFTLVTSGGIILAEHVPKAIIFGADLVGIDTTPLVALQMRFKGECVDADSAEFYRDSFDVEWGVNRLTNLFGAWHNQILEILSAMGMRDIRRLRGDIGRAIIKEEMEAEAFEGIRRITD